MIENVIENEIKSNKEPPAPLSVVHKCAKLVFGDKAYSAVVGNGFDPLTNKSDLMDLENAFYTSLMNILPSRIEFWGAIGNQHAEITVYIEDYPDKFTARSAAVCAVAEQIYDKGQV